MHHHPVGQNHMKNISFDHGKSHLLPVVPFRNNVTGTAGTVTTTLKKKDTLAAAARDGYFAKCSIAVSLTAFKSSFPVPSSGMFSISRKLSGDGIQRFGKPAA